MNAEQIIKAAIPDASEAIVDHVLWGRTPFPMGKITAQSLYRAASGYRRACLNKRRQCDFCDRLAVDGWCCERCNEALKP